MECYLCGARQYIFLSTVHQKWCKYYRPAKPAAKVVKKTPGVILTIPHPEGWDI